MSSGSSNGKRGAFGSRLGFILAAAGSAVGLGNIWRFPYAAGQGGGGAFVLVYLLFVVVIGVPVLLAELSLGRATRANPVGAFRKIVPNSLWPWVGGLGVVTGLGILSFYSVVAGWTLSYLGRAATGTFSGEFSPEQSGALFGRLISDPAEVLVVTTAFIALTALVVRGGVGGGIERAAKILMPMFFCLLVLLAIRSLTLPGASEGLKFLFSPDFSKLDAKTIMFALGQALFSLSLGMGAMITYGSYLQKKERLATAGVAVAVFDTGIALLAGLLIFPALFTYGVSPDKGPGLVFVVLPTIFHSLPMGNLFAIAFYSLLGIAALTSTISLLEVVVSYVVDELKLSRERAVWTLAAACLVLAIPCALSLGAVESLTKLFQIGGEDKGWLDLQDIVFGNLSLSLGALFTAIFVGWKWGIDNAFKEMPDLPAKELWSISIRFICPLAVLIVLGFIIYSGGTL